MEIRTATILDLKNVLDFMEAYHATSNLADVPFARRSAFKMVDYYIRAQDTVSLIAVGDEGTIEGVLLGGLEPYFFNERRNYATDLFFISHGYGAQLWRRFKKWAFDKGADRIIMGVSSGNPRACELLEALGMDSTGGMYVIHQKGREESIQGRKEDSKE